MSDAAPIVGRGEVLLAGELLAGEHVPQPELGLQPAVGLTGHSAGDQRLRVDGLPVGKARHRVDIRNPLDEGRRIDRGKQSGTLQVGGDHLRRCAPRHRPPRRRRRNSAARSASADGALGDATLTTAPAGPGVPSQAALAAALASSVRGQPKRTRLIRES
jgi:hypothetical protein